MKSFKGLKWTGMAFAVMLALFPFQRGFAQVTLKTPKTTLGVVIQKIQSQKKYQFFYDDSLSKIPVSALNVKNISIQALLKQLLNG